MILARLQYIDEKTDSCTTFVAYIASQWRSKSDCIPSNKIMCKKGRRNRNRVEEKEVAVQNKEAVQQQQGVRCGVTINFLYRY